MEGRFSGLEHKSGVFYACTYVVMVSPRLCRLCACVNPSPVRMQKQLSSAPSLPIAQTAWGGEGWGVKKHPGRGGRWA